MWFTISYKEKTLVVFDLRTNVIENKYYDSFFDMSKTNSWFNSISLVYTRFYSILLLSHIQNIEMMRVLCEKPEYNR